jgi:hypothetical protein
MSRLQTTQEQAGLRRAAAARKRTLCTGCRVRKTDRPGEDCKHCRRITHVRKEARARAVMAAGRAYAHRMRAQVAVASDLASQWDAWDASMIDPAYARSHADVQDDVGDDAELAWALVDSWEEAQRMGVRTGSPSRSSDSHSSVIPPAVIPPAAPRAAASAAPSRAAEIDCPVCSEKIGPVERPGVKRQQITRCMHRFCRQCLRKWITAEMDRTGERDVPCPLCRTIL